MIVDQGIGKSMICQAGTVLDTEVFVYSLSKYLVSNNHMPFTVPDDRHKGSTDTVPVFLELFY